MSHWKPKLHLLSQEIFQYSLGTYLILVFCELIKAGSVTNFININVFLGAMLISGCFAIITYTRIDHSDNNHNYSIEIQNNLIIAILGAGLVYLATQQIGDLSFILTIFSFLLILTLSSLISN